MHCGKYGCESSRGIARGQGDAIPWAPNHYGGENYCGKRRKVPTMSQVLFQCSIFASERPQVRTWGRQTCFLPRAPSNLVTLLASSNACWRYVCILALHHWTSMSSEYLWWLCWWTRNRLYLHQNNWCTSGVTNVVPAGTRSPARTM